MDDITLLLAVYSAVLSTILALKEITKERKFLKIILQYNEFGAWYSIVCTNVGHRPITLVNISIVIPGQDAMPRNALYGLNDLFPVTLEDGDHCSFKLSLEISEYIYKVDGKIKIYLYDADGKSYTKYERISHNEKFGTYKKFSK
jgi:hypothetical protein